MARVPRPTEDAVLQALRRILEPHGFRYKARKLIKPTDQWRIIVYLFRARWTKPEEEIFDILIEVQVECPAGIDGVSYTTTISQAAALRGGMFYGRVFGVLEPVDPDVVVEDFQSSMLPVILASNSPVDFAEALVQDELAPGVPNWFSFLDRAREAYRLADCLGLPEVTNRAVGLLRELAEDPTEREAAQFMWQSLQIPGSLVP